jgi:methyl-accepting chemotaxis protein
MHRTIGTHFHWATTAAVVMIAIVLALVFVGESQRIEEARVTQMHIAVDSATAICAGYEREERAGNLSHAEAQRAASSAVRAIRYLGNESVWITDLKPRMVMDPVDPWRDGTDLDTVKGPDGRSPFVEFAAIARAAGAGVIARPVARLAYVRGLPTWGWVLGTAVYADDLTMERWYIGLALAGLGIVAALAIGLVVWRLGRGVARAVNDLAAATALLAHGDLSVCVLGADRRDEIGALAYALETLKRHAIDRLQIVRAGLEERAAKERRQAAMDRLTKEFSEVVSGVLTGLTHTARNMSETARAIPDDGARTPDIGLLATFGLTEAQSDPMAIRQAALATSEDLVRSIETLRDEVDQFVRNLALGEAFRRCFERVPGNDAPAMLVVPNGPEIPAMIRDISRGGAAFRSGFQAEVGDQVMVALPGSTAMVTARVVRHADGIVAVAFRQDQRTMAEVDAVTNGLIRESSLLAAA